MVFEHFAGLLHQAADAGVGDLQQVGQHGHGADLPLVDQGEQQACGVVEQWPAAQLAGRSPGSAAALFGVTLLGAGGPGRGDDGGQLLQVGGGHAGQPGIGQPAEHGLAPARGSVLLSDGLGLGGGGGGAGVQGVVPGAVGGVPPERQGVEALLADRHAGRVVAGVQGGLHPQPAAGVVAAMVLTMTWWLVSGRPRQLRVRWENSRCWI